MGNRTTKRNIDPCDEGATLINENNVKLRKNENDPPFSEYAFPFENAVFAGAGSMCLAYCGAVKVLEDAGLWKQITRFSGSGTGALLACLFAVEMTATNVENALRRNFKHNFAGKSRQGCVSCCSKKIGGDSAKRMYNWLGKKLKDATGNADVTFHQVFEQYGNELCIPVTNLSQLMVEYWHPKTKPDMPIRLAVKMTMADPVIFKPVKNPLSLDTYIAGGPLCNYPIHCFDGWYLSLRSEDNFIKHLHSMDNQSSLLNRDDGFMSFNQSTLGFIPYFQNEKGKISSLSEKNEMSYPHLLMNSKLARKRLRSYEERLSSLKKYNDLLAASDKLLTVLKEKMITNAKSDLTKEEFQEALHGNLDFTMIDLQSIMGENVTPSDLIKVLFVSDDSTVTFVNVVEFLEAYRVKEYEKVQNLQRSTIKSRKEYAQQLKETLCLNSTNVNTNKKDLERTVAIDTCYITANDWDLEGEDHNLLMEQGKRAMHNYLINQLKFNTLPLKNDWRNSYCNDQVNIYADDDVSSIADEYLYLETQSFLNKYI